MKVIVFWLSVCIMIACVDKSRAQKKKKGTYKLWVELMHSDEVVTGKLLELGDSVITMRLWESEVQRQIEVSEIKRMKFRRKGAVGKGAAIGAGAGIVAGVIIGLADGDDTQGFIAFSAEEKSVINGIGLLFVGAPVGAIIGSLRKKFHIKGQRAIYEESKHEMSRYVQVTYLSE